MKYRWLKGQTCKGLSQELGCDVHSIMIGHLPIDAEGLFTQEGIELELENETDEILQRLDLMLLGLKRENGRDAETIISENIVTESPNPYKEAFKLSQLYGLTRQQLENHIENNVNDLPSAKAFLKKLSAVVLWLVKQTKLDE